MRSLNRHFLGDDNRRAKVMEFMRISSSQSYLDVALDSLSSPIPGIRKEALRILSFGDRTGLRPAIAQALLNDPSAEVRKEAASLIGWRVVSYGRASISAGDREALAKAVAGDGDGDVREEAQRALDAKRSTTRFRPDGRTYSVED